MKIIKCSGREELNNKLTSMFINNVNVYLTQNDYLNIGIATGNTFIEFMHYLNDCNNIPLNKINLFVIDEYVGVDPYDTRSCTVDLINELKCLNQFRNFYTFNKESYYAQIDDYNKLLSDHPFDILLLGVGNDGHFGFNNYPETIKTKDFYKIVEFSEIERQQQVDRGWFEDIHIVPQKGITITEFSVIKSSTTIFAAYYDQKRSIISNLLDNNINNRMAIFPFLTLHNCLLIYG